MHERLFVVHSSFTASGTFRPSWSVSYPRSIPQRVLDGPISVIHLPSRHSLDHDCFGRCPCRGLYHGNFLLPLLRSTFLHRFLAADVVHLVRECAFFYRLGRSCRWLRPGCGGSRQSSRTHVSLSSSAFFFSGSFSPRTEIMVWKLCVHARSSAAVGQHVWFRRCFSVPFVPCLAFLSFVSLSFVHVQVSDRVEDLPDPSHESVQRPRLRFHHSSAVHVRHRRRARSARTAACLGWWFDQTHPQTEPDTPHTSLVAPPLPPPEVGVCLPAPFSLSVSFPREGTRGFPMGPFLFERDSFRVYPPPSLPFSLRARGGWGGNPKGEGPSERATPAGTERDGERQRWRETEMETGRDGERQRWRETETHRDRQRWRQAEMESDRGGERQRHTETDRDRQRQTETGRDGE